MSNSSDYLWGRSVQDRQRDYQRLLREGNWGPTYVRSTHPRYDLIRTDPLISNLPHQYWHHNAMREIPDASARMRMRRARRQARARSRVRNINERYGSNIY
jgi:hypothetical protein